MNKNLNRLPEEYCDLCFSNSIMNWDEAIPLGNGLTGCLIWGDGSPLRFSLDRGDLWDNRPAPETLSGDFNYKKLIEFVKNKDEKAIKEKFEDSWERATPTKIPAGKIEIDYGKNMGNINSCLHLYNGVAEISIDDGTNKSSIKTFLHATNGIGYIHIRGLESIKGIRLKVPEFGTLSEAVDEKNELDGHISKGSLNKLKYPPAEYIENDDITYFIQKTVDDLEYGIFMVQKKVGDNIDIVYYIAANIDGENWIEDAENRILSMLKMDFDKALIEHEEWWKSFWYKSSIDLPNIEYEKMWYLNNYLFGSSSRKNAPPMPLQGVWTADDGQLPPWKGDYHHDLNTQMSYWHYLKANHIEEGESFIDYLWDLVPEARQFAKDFFDAPGLCLPSTTTLDGTPIGGWAMYSYNFTNQIWLCQAFDRHWEYTGDIDFLEKKAYPYLKDTAICIMQWLVPDSKGKLLLPLSSSPEIHDNNYEAWLTPNSNYDLELLIYLFKTLYKMADILNYEEKDKWEEKLNSLPELAINDNNVLMLSPDESLNESHRHHAHAMAIYPLDLLNYHSGGRDKQIIDETINNLELLGTGLWVGFSFPWMAEFYARQCNGEGAAYQLKLFWEVFCSQNGFNLNGDFNKYGITQWHYRPFTLEANMCAADALQEMLLQTYDGIIRVFPAIPESWRKNGASFSSFRGMKGILISSSIKNGEVEYIHLVAHNDGNYLIQNEFNSDKIIIKRRNCLEEINCHCKDNFTIELLKDEICHITAKK